jgi:hypothetical protein
VNVTKWESLRSDEHSAGSAYATEATAPLRNTKSLRSDRLSRGTHKYGNSKESNTRKLQAFFISKAPKGRTLVSSQKLTYYIGIIT